ncbi:MAG TPA: DinB family protein, partial [Thermoanaerobaculia bacterium]|nr:DinB family protein [Thermoanaerobaculia bacterium]
LGLFLIVLLVAASVAAGEKPPVAKAPVSDQDEIVRQLERTQSLFLKSIEGLSEAQWTFKPATERWSIAECAEHIAASEPFIREMIAKAVANELTPEMLTAGTRHDEKLLKGLIDRSQKFKAPEPLIPTNRFGTPEAAIEAFKKERGETIKLAKNAGDLRTHGDKHFLFGPLDAYGWFLFTSGHSERHTLQIEEVKADAGFPK